MKRNRTKNEDPVITLVTPDELADRLGVSSKTVRRWVELKILPEPVKINTRVHRFNLHACLNAVASYNAGVNA